MNGFNDRLYALLPTAVRIRDLAADGQPLRSILSVICEQVDLVENNIAQLYANWFIETCQEWAVPYIGDLIGYQVLHEGGEPSSTTSAEGLALDRILVPRQDVGNTVHARRRKGTLGVLPELARDVAGWPAVAVEFGKLASITQALEDLRGGRGRLVDLHAQPQLEQIGGPLDAAARVAEVRGNARPSPSGSLPTSGVGLFVPRYRCYAVSNCTAGWIRDVGDHCFTFSALGDDVALYGLFPTALTRDDVADSKHYGAGKSLAIWTSESERGKPRLVPLDAIVPANLAHWRHEPEPGKVAVDALRGRLSFPRGQVPNRVYVAYHHGFSFDIGAGEYPRGFASVDDAKVYSVSSGGRETHNQLAGALASWKSDNPSRAIIEIADSEVYDEDDLRIELAAGQHLEIRAASGARPIIRMVEVAAGSPDRMRIAGDATASCVIDGLTFAGGLHLGGGLGKLVVRRSTLVPGWVPARHAERRRHIEPSIAVNELPDSLVIEKSIVGPISVERGERAPGPLQIAITDSIVDAFASGDAVSSPDAKAANAEMRIVRATIVGRVLTHGILLAENSIFDSVVTVTDRQHGRFRYCYMPPKSLTPQQYECRPARGVPIVPAFISKRYGDAGYMRLQDSDAQQPLLEGADDRAELGAFHDLFLPQRKANLVTRLAEYTPAGVTTSIILVA
ncbi:MAG TPA: hypothetical protein VGI19_19880 [Candidatus Cybelea sp.]